MTVHTPDGPEQRMAHERLRQDEMAAREWQGELAPCRHTVVLALNGRPFPLYLRLTYTVLPRDDFGYAFHNLELYKTLKDANAGKGPSLLCDDFPFDTLTVDERWDLAQQLDEVRHNERVARQRLMGLMREAI